MNHDIYWLLIAVAALGTFSLRFSFIAFLDKIREPPWFREALEYIPAAVMAALVSSSLLIRDGELALTADNYRLPAALVAAVVGWFTRSLLWTIISGLAVLMILSRWLGPAI